MLKALGLPLICAATFMLMGGHWAVLQGVAWTQMVWSYSQETGSLAEGVTQTFSGERPCSLCKTVTEGREQEKKAPVSLMSEKKAEITIVAFGTDFVLPDAQKSSYLSFEVRYWTRAEAPPTPVPIVLVA
jgi:hypothetical protein